MENTTSGQFQPISCTSITATEENPQGQSSSLQPYSITTLGFEAIKEEALEPSENTKYNSCRGSLLQDEGHSTCQPYAITTLGFEAIKEEVTEPSADLKSKGFGDNVQKGDGNSTCQQYPINSLEFDSIKDEVAEPTDHIKCDSCGNYVLQDFGLCLTCYEGGSSPGDQTQANRQEARKQTVQKCVNSLEHACYCRDAGCALPICRKIKNVVQHTKSCKRKATGECSTCRILVAICCYHAKYCVETKCPVPFCPNIKYKAKSQLEMRLQEVQTVMNTRSAGKPQAVAPPPHQPSASVLQVVRQIQEEAAQQQAALYNGKQATPYPYSGTTSHPVEGFCRAAVSQSLLQLSQPPSEEELQETGLWLPPRGQPRGQGLVVGDVQQAQSGPNLAVYQQASKQLLEIVKRQPQLMAAFIKQRQTFQAMQQQQRTASVSQDPSAQNPQHTMNQQENPQ